MSNKPDLVVEKVDADGNKLEIPFDGDQAEVVVELQSRAAEQTQIFRQQIQALKQPRIVSYVFDNLTYYCPKCGHFEKITEHMLQDAALGETKCENCDGATLAQFIQYRQFTYTANF